MKELTRIEKFAEDYAGATWKKGCFHVAREGYISGYFQAVEDTVDLDEWQKLLSDSYSDIKEKYAAMKCEMKELRKRLIEKDNPSHEEKLQMYLDLKEEFEKVKTYY